MKATERPAAPFAAVAFGIALFCGLDAIAKALSGPYGVSQAVTMRYGAGALVAVAIWAALGAPKPSVAALKANALRAVLVTLTAFTFFYALSRLPLAETIALTFTSPIIIALLGRPLLNEPVGRSTMSGIALGFIGVLVIAGARAAGPEVAASALDGVAAALASAFFYALSMVMLRQRASQDPLIVIVLLQSVFATLFAAPVGAIGWIAPTLRDAGLALIAGALGTFGYLALAWGYARAEAARLGTLEYTSFLWAALIGWIVFGEIPGAATLAGGVLIIAGALLAARASKTPPSVAPPEAPAAETR